MLGLEKSRTGEGIEENMRLFMKSETAINHDRLIENIEDFSLIFSIEISLKI